MPDQPSSGLTGLGKFISIILVLAVVALGGWIVIKKMGTPETPPTTREKTVNTQTTPPKQKLDAADLLDVKTEVPTLAGGIAYTPKDNILDIELSQYAGYSGFIAANGGMDPNPDSLFAKKYGFKVRLKLSEEESWNKLNRGEMAASATTANVLAVYGRQMQVIVTAQIGYSRGADGLVVQNDIHRFNQLKGKIVATTEFTEADFFVRYLAHEAGIDVKILPDASSKLDPDKINLLFCKDGKAAEVMRKDMKDGTSAIAGVMAWAPDTTDLVSESDGKLHLLVTNRNLLIIADVFIVNRGFAEKNPDKVAALVDCLLAGNKMVRDNPAQYADMLGVAFNWDDAKTAADLKARKPAELRARTLAELQKVHLANLPENLAFFSGGITAGGSFASIYQSSVLAYGTDLIANPVDSDYFVDLAALKKAEASGAYKDQVAMIAPLTSGTSGPIEKDPLLSKDIRFLFEANKANLDLNDKGNLDNLTAIRKMLDVSPGSRILLRGHVDNANIPMFRQQGGEDLVRRMALVAMDLSKQRANEIKRLLIEREKVDPKRLETVGRGWEEPAGTDQAANRRVEVQWFTLE